MTSTDAVPSRSDHRDLALVRRLEGLYTAVVSDCLDSVGLRDNAMAPRIRPLYPTARLAGYAATVTAVVVDAPPADPAENYAGELAAVDALQPGDVMVVSCGGAAFWGELLATASQARGAHGIVVDGLTRDANALSEMGFPTFVAGIGPQDSLGRIDVTGHGDPVDCGGVTVHNGDLILADFDGIVIVPADVAEEVIARAEAKVSAEDEMRRSLRDGMPVTAAFARHQVL